MVMMFPAPMKIIENRGLTVMLYETNGAYRQIFTDGRSLPKDPVPTWLGYSVGHWERGTFVVESAGFNAKTWIDAIGHPHGEQLRLTERYRRKDFGHMDLDIAMEDAKYYTRPINLHLDLTLQTGTDIYENVCTENEKDRAHVVLTASPSASQPR